jgi:enoyl-CoA hydratase
VPLVDGGTVRLPRIVGQGPALDLILTGRAVDAPEALRLGLATRVVPSGTARDAAVALATELAALPLECLRNDRASVYAQWDLGLADALRRETELGIDTLRAPGAMDGATRFAGGAGRHGTSA